MNHTLDFAVAFYAFIAFFIGIVFGYLIAVATAKEEKENTSMIDQRAPKNNPNVNMKDL